MGPARAPLFTATRSFGLWLEERLIEEGYARFVGLDEAGRGPLAGPVVACAVVLSPGRRIPGLDDSKRLTEAKRRELFHLIFEYALSVTVAVVGPREIDRTNILRASLAAMARAARDAAGERDVLLVDGPHPVPLSIPQLALVKGDRYVPAVQAASVVSKVTRDGIMVHLGERYPGYGFHRHKGYPTRAHRDAITALGPSPVHRMSFRGVREHIGQGLRL